jgi:hypothetical protein
MTTLWDKLNLKEGQELVVVNAPKTFAAALKALAPSRVQQRISAAKKLTFVLVFVERKSELDKLSAAVIAKASPISQNRVHQSSVSIAASLSTASRDGQ